MFDTENFKIFVGPKSAVSYVSGLKRIEQLYDTDIDECFVFDKCASLIEKLKIRKKDNSLSETERKAASDMHSHLIKYVAFRNSINTNGDVNDKIKSIIAEYKLNFITRWEDEKYKWQAIKHYQETQSSEFDSFADKFLASTEKHFNLLSTGSYWQPRSMIGHFCNLCGDEEIATQFNMLYDESKDLKTRIQNFMDYFASEERIGKVSQNAGKALKTNQDPRSVSVYLATEFPEKYYFYMPSIYDKAKEIFDFQQPKGFSPVDKMLKYFDFCDEICKYVKQDTELIEMVSSAITEEEYEDNALHILVQDILFFYMHYAKAHELLNKKVDLCWYVGAFISSEDKTDEFIDNDIWINGYADKYLDTVNSIKVGDRIAIKSAYTQKYNLPFNINGGTASVMEIKAVGTVIRNHKDGRTLDVDWMKLSPSKKWYFYTMRNTIWKVERTDDDSYNNALLDFTFEDKFQVYNDFLTHPFWADKYLLDDDENGKVTYLSEIIESMKELGGIASLNEINNKIEERSLLGSIKSNSNWKRAVSATIQRYCSETKSYIEGNDDIFYSVEGIGKGIWGLVDYNLEENEPEQEAPVIIPYKKNNFLNDVYITSTEYDKLYTLLKHKKNIILQGAPGVGKTFAAKRLAYSIMGEKDDNRVQCVQFHQSYSYEDFIEGYRPLEDGGFELRDGVFKKFCDKASRNTDKEYFFIIDEINRGNMSKIFGELLMLIESDKRGSSHYLNLVYSNEPFFVPENLHIIGMMNTADRSLAMIDYALRRRFSFYSMKPAFDSDGFKKHAEQVNCELFHKAIEAVKNLNAVIVDDKSLGKGFEIGHSYFCTNKPESITDEIVKNIIAFEIIPTIEEYWFDNETRLDTESQKLEALLGDDNGAI